MSISLEEAKRKIDILEKAINNPELILTDLFTNEVSGCNFLYQVDVNDHHIYDFIKENLPRIPAFKDCTIHCDGYTLKIYIPALKKEGYRVISPDDLILTIDLNDKTFKLYERSIEAYENVIQREYKLELMQESKWIKEFENLTVLKRFSNAIRVTKEKKMSRPARFYAFFFYLFVSDGWVNKMLEKERNKIKEHNEMQQKEYERKTKLQNYYLEHAPAQIKKLKDRQERFSEYLCSIGYGKRIPIGMIAEY